MDGWKVLNTTSNHNFLPTTGREKRKRKEGRKRMKEHRVKNWTIVEHDNGVTEFITHKRALMLTPAMPEAECISVMNALPKYVLERWIRLINIQLSKDEVKRGEL